MEKLLVTEGEGVMEAVRLLERQRNRQLFHMDDQLATQKQVAEFIERYK